MGAQAGDAERVQVERESCASCGRPVREQLVKADNGEQHAREAMTEAPELIGNCEVQIWKSLEPAHQNETDEAVGRELTCLACKLSDRRFACPSIEVRLDELLSDHQSDCTDTQPIMHAIITIEAAKQWLEQAWSRRQNQTLAHSNH